MPLPAPSWVPIILASISTCVGCFSVFVDPEPFRSQVDGISIEVEGENPTAVQMQYGSGLIPTFQMATESDFQHGSGVLGNILEVEEERLAKVFVCHHQT
jgi:hypothetical protein